MQEHTTALSTSPEVEYVRGSDYGGGIGGLLYSVRSTGASFNHYNSRGDVIAKTDGLGALTYEGQYEAFGKRTEEIGINIDRQTANTKDEDPHGLLNEGMRYRDLEPGVFITRDPLGFVDGPNVYTYVLQNPWSKFDPKGLAAKKTEVTGQVYEVANHEKKQVYVGMAWGEGVMEKGGASERMKSSKHPARQLIDSEGTTRKITDVHVSGDWRSIAQESGELESTARKNAVMSAERAQLETTIKDYRDRGYTILNDSAGSDRGRGIIGKEKAMHYADRYSVKLGESKSEVNMGGKWLGSGDVQTKQLRASGRAALLGVAFMIAGQASGAENDAREVRANLELYQRNPNQMTGNRLGESIGRAYGAPPIVTADIMMGLTPRPE